MNLLPVALVIFSFLVGCAGDSNEPAPNSNAPVAQTENGDLVPASKAFECKSRDEKSKRVCDSQKEYCLATEVRSGHATTIQCASYPDSLCTTQDCLTEHAKSLFPASNNCSYTIMYVAKGDTRTIRCVHPYLYEL